MVYWHPVFQDFQSINSPGFVKCLCKKNIFFISSFFLFLGVRSYANPVPQLLTGNLIAYDQRNRHDHKPEDAFDGDLDTYFQSDGVFGNWIGLDLGSPHIITSVDFYSRKDNKPEEYANRLALGVFEGANHPDFGDAVALTIIPRPPHAGKNTLTINCSKCFRYVRFLFPSNAKHYTDTGLSKYIGEMQFYGYPGVGNNAQLPTLTNLPTINIHTTDAQEINSQEIYINGIISVIYENGTKFYTDSIQIRGRGNNSWTHPKKPYKVKLNKSTKLMGLPSKAKNWTLINNYGDKTLMRNILAFDFSRRLEMPYTSPAEAVDLVLNGDYKGCYQLCDRIDVRKGRVDVKEMTAADLTGGYLLEIDAYAYPKNKPKKFTSNPFNIPGTIKYPKDDEITKKQEQYIEDHFNKLMRAINDENQRSIEQYLNLSLFLRHFLINEYTGNTDGYWQARLSKEKDEDQFCFGPVWDFDLGFENDHRTYPINDRAWNSNQWVSLAQGSSAAGDGKNMLRKILSKRNFQTEMEAIYAYYRDRDIIDKDVLVAVVDSCEQWLDESQQLNFQRWGTINIKVHENPQLYGSYAGEVDNVRNYIRERIDWMDYKLAYERTPLPNAAEGINSLDLAIQSRNGILSVRRIPQGCHVRVLNLQGVVCFQHDLSTDFDTTLSRGVYLIVVEKDNEVRTIKHVIQ